MVRCLLTPCSLLLFSFSLFAANSLVPLPSDSLPPAAKYSDKEFFMYYETMPIFLVLPESCPDSITKDACAQQAMLEELYGNLRWPSEAKSSCGEGMAVIRFIVDQQGFICDPTIVRDPGMGMGKEALAAVRALDTGQPRFKPGTFMHKPVEVMYHLPVKFRLQ